MNESILNLFDEFIYISDIETYELYFMNTACKGLFGVTDESYRGRRCHKVLQGLDEPCPFCNNEKLIEEQFYEWEYYNPECDGYYAIKDKKFVWKERWCRFEMAREITTLKRQQEQHRKSMGIALEAAQQAGKARARFLSRVSHELRTPLNAILGLINVASAAQDQPVLVGEAHKKMESSARYLLTMLNDILDVAHMESGSFVLEPASFEFSDLLGELCSLYVLESRQRHVVFRPSLEYFPAETLYADSIRLKQLLSNLLSNAFKFTEPGGEVLLEVRPWRSGNETLWLEFVITDTGIGMSSEFMGKMFDPFEGEAEGGRGASGAGLGLSISKKIVDLMGGTLDIESQLGKGTCCVIRLPMGVRRSRRDAMDPAVLRQLQSLRLLVVDDAQGCRNIKQILDSLSVHADVVTSGAHAVDFLGDMEREGRCYDMCIVHEKVRDLDFAGFWERVSEGHGVRKEDCVVSMLSYGDASQIMQTRGISRFLGKPYLTGPLLDILCGMRGLPLPPRQVESKGYDFSGKRLLLVEDNEINREVAFELLSKVCKFSVEMAQNGQESVEMFIAHPAGYYDIILMDICMPVMDGHTAALEIRGRLKNGGAHVPIVALSANSMEEDKEKSRVCGINAHVAKPLDLDVLCPALAQAMA